MREEAYLTGANATAATLFPAEMSAPRFKGWAESAKFSTVRNRGVDREKLTGR